MRKVRCYECGKSYDYDEDGFCPRCGSFNQPAAAARIRADGAVVRMDGINEANHANSFVHRELHEEKQERRKYGLDKSVQRIQRGAHSPAGSASFAAAKSPKASAASVIAKIIFALIALNIFLNLLAALF